MKQLCLYFKGLKGAYRTFESCVYSILLRALDPPNTYVFETAPALRRVAVGGNSSFRVLLPWSQIIHFEEEPERSGIVGKLVLLPSSSQHSLTNLDIYRPPCLLLIDESALISPYRPTTLPNLRTLRVVIYICDYKDVDLFLESLTIRAVEVVKFAIWGL